MKNYVPRYIYWELSNFCNLRCKHCFAEADGDITSIANQDQIQAKLEEMHNYGTFAVRLGGGEPLMVPYIFELIRFCRSKNIAVDMTTNGTLISDEILRELKAAGLRELTISLDGLQKAHDIIRGQGMFQRSIDAVKKALLHNGIAVSVAFTVTALNYDQIEDFVEELVEIGVKKFYFFRYCENSNSDFLHLTRQNLKCASASIHKLSQMYERITFVHEELSFYTKHWSTGNLKKEGCNFLKGVMSVDYRGNVVVCAAINKVLGSIFGDNLENIYENIQREQKEICFPPDACHACHYQKVCHGGCKSHSYHSDGTYRIRDNFCYLQD